MRKDGGFLIWAVNGSARILSAVEFSYCLGGLAWRSGLWAVSLLMWFGGCLRALAARFAGALNSRRLKIEQDVPFYYVHVESFGRRVQAWLLVLLGSEVGC